MWKQLKYHPVRQELYTNPGRFPLVAAGRGSGKSEYAKRFVVRQLPLHKPWEDPCYFYGLPTYGQAKRVAWESFLKLIPQQWIKGEPSVSELVIKTVFGSSLHIVGMDKPMRIEGTQWDGGVLDEYGDQKPGAFGLSVLPALAFKRGWCWRIGVPKRFGIGAAKFHEEFHLALEGKTPESKAFTWSSEDILTPEEIISAKSLLGVKEYNEQYRASWEDKDGLVFYAFSAGNVTSEAVYQSDQPIIVSSDFNVDPMSWVLCHKTATGLNAFDEVCLRNTNTQKTLDELYRRYGPHQSGWMFVGDASSKARKTSATTSDLAQIMADNRFINKKVMYSKSNPPVADRNAAVNALCLNAMDEVRLRIHPRCLAVIKDLSGLSYIKGTREIQPVLGMGHMSDALGYVIYKLYPVTVAPSQPKSSIIST
jgi:hypothetical protein